MSESGDEMDYSMLTAARNRKQRKAGGWQALGLDHTILKGIQRKGFQQPTPIQRRAIPAILEGRDVVAMSRTGSGKTAAFVIPILQRLRQRSMKGLRVLLISPTRELALQTFAVTKQLGRFTGLRCCVLVGGDSIEEQFAAVHENPDILIATPGRLLHLVVEMNLRLSCVEMLIFDEADRLFEMGFAEQLEEVIRRVPESKQTLLFSATLPKLLVDFAKAGLTHPLLVRLDVDSTMSERLRLSFLGCRDSDRLAILLQLIRRQPENERTIVFCATMKHVEFVAAILVQANLRCSFLYSQLDSVARNIQINRFRNYETQILVVTDIAARGVDIPLVENAINLHFPPKAKLFVHRVGRVARAGQPGHAISLFSCDELPYLADLFLFLGRPLKFANSQTGQEDGLIGNVPDDLVQLETEFLKNTIGNSEDIIDMQQKAENSMKKYIRTRPQPSAESVRRVKKELRKQMAAGAPHPIFANGPGGNMEMDEKRGDLITALRNFKPITTIFEFQSSSKRQSAAIMKRKRREHQHYIERKAVNASDSGSGTVEVGDIIAMEEELQGKSTIPLEESDRKDQDVVFDEIITERKFRPVTTKKRALSKHAEMLQRERQQHFIPYVPTDAHSEKALAVIDRGGGFDREIRNCQLDIVADEDRHMQKQKDGMKRWDRKLKRFVGQINDDPAKKKIRTEDGIWLPASYKSGRYERWQKKQQLQYQRNDGEEEGGEAGDDGQGNSTRGGARMLRRHGKRGGRGSSFDAGKQPRSELKGHEQILKQRKRKSAVQAYQKHRHGENMKKRGAGSATGRGRSSGRRGSGGGKRGR